MTTATTTPSNASTPISQETIRVDGMTCGHCSSTVAKALKSVPGVQAADVNHASGTALIHYTGKPQPEQWSVAVKNAGYSPIEASDKRRPAVRERIRANRELKLLLWSLFWTAPVMIIHMGGLMDHGDHAAGHLHWQHRVILICATVLQPTSAITYYRGALRSIARRSADMDLLVSLGVASGYIYAVLSTFMPESFPGNAMEFFEAATLLICFIRLGKWIEALSRARAAEAMGSLLDITPSKVRLIGDDGSETMTPVEELVIGHRFAVLPGDVVAVDGRVVEGESLLDESVITGESRPVSRSAGERVIAGSGNLRSRLVIRATAVGSDTTVAQIVKMVEQAQADKAPIQRTADRIASIFVPVVVCIAIASGLYWGLIAEMGAARVLTHVIGVLVIACPCALGIAVPAAIMTGSAAGMKKGILVKSGAALELLDRLTVIAFDKTGTLTEGRPRVVDCQVRDGFDQQAVARAVLGAERASNHPASLAASNWAREVLGADAEQAFPMKVEEAAGQGVAYTDRGVRVRLGRAAFAGGGASESPTGSGSVSFVTIDDRPAGALTYTDPIRPEAVEMIADLRRRGIKPVLISGDRESAVADVAKAVGIEQWHAEEFPEGKLALIQQMQDAGEKVGMVGDGVNDAPALARSDLGIAMGAGAGISKGAGSLVLTGGGIGGVQRALELSRRVRIGIRANLAGSMVYNLIGIPLAAGVAALYWEGVVIPPGYAALAMVLSDISVVGATLLLARSLRSV
jgi:Cu+-exporting ATPase